MKRRLGKLEQTAEGRLFETLNLEDGTEIKCAPGETLEAVVAAIGGHEHRLLPHLRRMNTNKGLPGLIWALETSRERRDDGA